MTRGWLFALVLAWTVPAHAEEDAPAAATAASAPSPKPVPNDRSVPPRLITTSCRPPDYPLASVRAKEAGTAVVRVSVNEKGEASDATVETSSGHVRLDRAFRHAVTLCKFHPGLDTIGNPLPRGVATVRHTWRLEDAPPDPWIALRAAASAARWTATEDLAAATLFTAPSATTADQRAKVLRRLQDTARENAGCPSIERVTPAPTPASWNMPAVVESASGRPVRIVSELWNTTQCDVEMTYSLVLRFPEDEPAHFVMIPVARERSASRAPTPESLSYGQRLAAAVGANIAYPAGPLRPSVDVKVRARPDGRITDVQLTRKSSDPSWDRAVLDAVFMMARLPKDSDGQVPPVVVFTVRSR